MNNFTNNPKRTPCQCARRKQTRGCEPSSLKLSLLFPNLSVTDGDTTRTFSYHADGQLASANYGDSSESFAWDGLALIQRGDEQFINELHIGGGNPVASSKGTSYFNDALGTIVGSKANGKYSAAVLSAFGENLANDSTDSQYFTGKPFVEGLGHAFFFRNYRAGLAKWQSADPMGYPDGWNQLAYCNNGVTGALDLWGCKWVNVRTWDNSLSVGEWEELSRTAKSDQEILAMLFKYGEFGWIRPVARKGAEQLISGPVTTCYRRITDLTWYENVTISYVYNRVDALEVTVTTKEFKDDPSMVNAFVELAFTLGAHIRNPLGKLIGLVSDASSGLNIIDEINGWLCQYGTDTVWTLDLGTITYIKIRQSSAGFFRVKE